jgi:Rieske 2Fe-2S family protein
MDDRARPTLSRLEPSLPTRSYIDPAHHDRELEAIWYRNWLCIGRTEELAEPRDYKVVEVGSQCIVVTRDRDGRLHAFHNTCRHRGSVLCTEVRGRFRGDAIVCPYHAWTYSLAGELKGVPRQLRSPDFRTRDFSLYRVALETWGGFIFVNLLGEAAPPLAEGLDELTHEVANWPLDTLRVGRRIERTLACNWKIFWENYLECFHCPRVHPELCRIVPIYGRGLQAEDEDPHCPPELVGRGTAPLAPGAVTWSLDGQTELSELPGLDDADRERGQSFGMLLPSVFVCAHIDYVRAVRVLPVSPEETRLVVEWLFSQDALEGGDPGLPERATALGALVVEQDARVCELNQRGLHCFRHERGVLVPQEYQVHDFHRWVSSALGELPPLAEQASPC